MANNKSALKRIRTTERNRLQNRFYKGNVKKLTKLFYERLEFYKTSQNSQDKKKVNEIVSALYSFIDKGQKKNVFHPNTASRKKATLILELKKIG
jgi:small subunit ribosomal protein S20